MEIPPLRNLLKSVQWRHPCNGLSSLDGRGVPEHDQPGQQTIRSKHVRGKMRFVADDCPALTCCDLKGFIPFNSAVETC